jgi:flagellar L-ring protein FlgH
MRNTTVLAALALALAGCQTTNDNLMMGPSLTPVGTGLDVGRQPLPVAFNPPSVTTFRSTWEQNSQSLYRTMRANRVGDVLTVTISMDDKASFDNATDRSRNAESKSSLVAALTAAGFLGPVNGAVDGNYDVKANTSTQGKGTIDRAEKLRLSIAAVVTEVLPNGNLMITGSQEIRVNYEVRVLNIAGIVNPLDVSGNNSIPYDKIAETRISYGGRGRLTDVQQPAWGQRIHDVVAPF